MLKAASFTSRVRYVAIVVSAALLLFLALELGVRAYFFLRLGPEDYLKYEFRHDPAYSVQGERELNSLGFRGKEFSVRKPNGTYRVIVVGGSEVFGVYVPLEESLPYLLEKKLSETFPSKKIEVINAGRLGSVAANEALLMEQLVHLSPDCIIVFNGWNDIYHSRYLPQQYEQVMKDTSRKFHWGKSLSRWFRRHLWSVRKLREWRVAYRLQRQVKTEIKESQPYHEWRDQVEASKGRAKDGEQWISFGWSGGYVHYPVSQLPKPSPLFAKSYYENLVRMAIIAKQHRVQLLFIFQPDLGYLKLHRPLWVDEEAAFEASTHQFSSDWYETVEKLYPVGIATMRQAAEKMQIPFYDFSLIFSETRQNAFFDAVHLNGFGNGRVAARMAEILRSL